MLADFHQRMQRGIENLLADVAGRVVLADGELTEAGAGGQALCQLQFEVLEAQAANGTMVGSLTPTTWARSAMELCITEVGSSSTWSATFNSDLRSRLLDWAMCCSRFTGRLAMLGI
jgi:hypothetical protein